MRSCQRIGALICGVLSITFFTACGVFSDPFFGIFSDDDAQEVKMTDVETELLALINAEREGEGLPTLVRDNGLDRIMLWYGTDMVSGLHIGHEDINGRLSEERINYYSDRDDVRCSEITAWWASSSANDHYQAYKASAAHHAAYMEEGIFNLGPTSHVGIVALPGTGPLGSEFEGRSGTYSGLVFCDQPVSVVIDPFLQ